MLPCNTISLVQMQGHLRDGDGGVDVVDDVPPVPRHEDGLPCGGEKGRWEGQGQAVGRARRGGAHLFGRAPGRCMKSMRLAAISGWLAISDGSTWLSTQHGEVSRAITTDGSLQLLHGL